MIRNEVAFIIPTLNEEDNITKIFDLIKNTNLNLNLGYEIIFVDDGSKDKTIDKIKLLKKDKSNINLIQNNSRKGLGNALLKGMNSSNANYIIFLDCDVSINKKNLEELLKNRKHDTMLIGSRYIKNSKIYGVPFIKSLLSNILNKIVSLIYHLKIRDVSHSLRIFPNIFQDLEIKILTHPGFFWEITIKFNRIGKLNEIPIQFNERRHGITKNKIKKLIISVFSFIMHQHKI